MADKPDDGQQVNFTLNPDKTPVYQIDGYLIGSNENVVTFNFGQNVMGGTQQNIVARVALSHHQAKEFLKNLNDHIEKFEV